MRERRGKTRSGPWFSSFSLALGFMTVLFSLTFVPVSIGGGYTYTELQPTGWDYISPTSINGNGVVVGSGSLGGVNRGFIYSGGNYTPLMPEGWQFLSGGPVINDAGTAVAAAYGPTASIAGFICSGTTCTPLTAPGWDYLMPASINNKGAIIGFGSQGGAQKAFVYDGTTCTALAPPGWDFLQPVAISSNGVVVGYGSQGYSWTGFTCSGTMCIPLAATNWSNLYPSAVNSRNVIVGVGMHLGVLKGFVYDGTTYTPILPDGWTSASLFSINDAGVMVGYGYQGGVRKVFVYDGTTYTPILPDGWTSAFALSINSTDVVAGGGSAGSVMKAFIAYPPTPEGQIAQVMDFFDASVAAGTLTGSSPGNSGQSQVKNLDKLLTSSAQSVAAGNDASACKDLAKAYSRADKHVKSSDSVAGAAAAELQQQIQGLMITLRCP